MTSSRRSLTLTCDFVLLILYIVHCSEQFGRFVMWPLSSLHSAATGTCCLSINADMVCNMLKRSSGKQHLITHKACCPVMGILALLWKSRKNLKLAWGRCLEQRKNKSVPVMCILSLIYTGWQTAGKGVEIFCSLKQYDPLAYKNVTSTQSHANRAQYCKSIGLTPRRTLYCEENICTILHQAAPAPSWRYFRTVRAAYEGYVTEFPRMARRAKSTLNERLAF